MPSTALGEMQGVRYTSHTMETAARQLAEQDERWVLDDEEDVPESPLHDAIIRLLVEILLAWNERVGGGAQIGRNIALRWNAQAPKQGVDPDLYVVDPAPPEGERATSLTTWKTGHHPPRVAVEVVSESTADKDYSDGPARYAASGTRELWVFDPLLVGPSAHGGPVRLQVWRREPDGNFRRVYAGDGPAHSDELGAWLVVTDEGQRLRIADDDEGTRPWPTGAEAERAAREAEREAKEAERAAREAAEAEVERLRAELALLRAGTPKR